MIGERIKQNHIQPCPGGVIFTPRDGDDCVIGDLLGDEYLTVVEPTATGEKLTITVGLHTGRRSFAITEYNDNASGKAVTAEKDAVLNALICRKRKDEQGRVILACALIYKTPQK